MSFVSAAVHGNLITYDARQARSEPRRWQSATRGVTRLYRPLIFTASDQYKPIVWWWSADLYDETDFFSYPVRPRSIRGRNAAAVGHDVLYRKPWIWDRRGDARRVTRKEADILFYLLLRSLDEPECSARVKYAAVRIGGSASFKRHCPRPASRCWTMRPDVNAEELPQ